MIKLTMIGHQQGRVRALEADTLHLIELPILAHQHPYDDAQAQQQGHGETCLERDISHGPRKLSPAKGQPASSGLIWLLD